MQFVPLVQGDIQDVPSSTEQLTELEVERVGDGAIPTQLLISDETLAPDHQNLWQFLATKLHRLRLYFYVVHRKYQQIDRDSFVPVSCHHEVIPYVPYFVDTLHVRLCSLVEFP